MYSQLLASYVILSYIIWTQAQTGLQSVLVSKRRLFRYQRQTYRGVQGRLQEYWRRYKARELTTSQLFGRCAHLTGPAQR